MRSPAVWTLVGLVGCASQSAPPKPTTITIDLDPQTVPLFLAIRDGDPADGARWQIRAEGESETSFPIDGPRYSVFIACEATSTTGDVFSRNTVRYDRTLDDATELAVRCNPSTGDGGLTHATGTMAQAGDVVLGSTDLHSDAANWTVDAMVGKRDTTLLAVTPDRFAIRRGIDTSGDTTDLGTIDVTAAGGGARIPVALDVTGFDPSETLDAFAELSIGGATYDEVPADQSFATLPDDALAVGDQQFWNVAARAADSTLESSSERGIELLWHAGLPTTYALPAPIAGASFAGLAVSWTSLPDEATDLAFGQNAFVGGTSVFNQVFATRNALAGDTAIDGKIDDTPNFTPSWQVVRGAAQGYSAYLEVDAELDTNGSAIAYATAGLTLH